MDTQYTSKSRPAPIGTDAVILLGATCGGPEEYALVADELGYGPLAMPTYCDIESIQHQLLKTSHRSARR